MPASTASFSFKNHPLIVVCLAFILTACGGGGSGDAIGSAAPTAGAVSISGTAQVGQTLTGNYTYADANNDPQGTSTFRWLSGGTPITGATSITYTLVSADQGSTITFEVTPEATVAPTTGTAVTSSATAAVAGIGTPAAPTAGAVSISGTAQVGQTLTGNYTYADANNDPQGTSTFRWLRGGTPITGATSITYTLVSADLRSTIRFEVTPEATVGPTTGTAVTSSATAEVIGFGFVSQGGLIWMPVSPVLYNWSQADSLCGGAIAGQFGWRLPTQLELGAFNAAYLGGSFELDSQQGWTLGSTWSATAASTPGWHLGYILISVSAFGSDDAAPHYVTCVRT